MSDDTKEKTEIPFTLETDDERKLWRETRARSTGSLSMASGRWHTADDKADSAVRSYRKRLPS
jgi:hypothetical protein